MTDPHTDGLNGPRRYLAVAVLLATLVLVVLDTVIANIALPSIAASFHARESDVVWVVSGYQLAVLVALLPCGALGEKFGPRRVYLGGVALFIAASAACAFSVSLPMLIAARFIQGLGGGAIMALAIMNLRFAVPQRLLGMIIGVNAMTVAVSSAAGPGIAGAILAVAHWPWLFAVNLPIGVVVLLCGGALMKTQGVPRRLNLFAILINALMFVLFFCGADQLTRAPMIGAGLILAAVLSLVCLLRLERGKAAPLFPVDLFAEPAFRIAVIASVCCFTGQMLSFVALPFYLQHNLHMSPTKAGLYMMPWPAAVAIIAPISGRLAGRIRTAWLCGAGGVLLAAGLALIAFGPADGRIVVFLIGSVIAGLGFGLFQTPNNRVLLLSAPKARSGAAGAMQGTARLTGQTFGSILMSITFGLMPLLAAPKFALGVAAAFAGLAAVISLTRGRYEVRE
ncbi:MFS transporter [Asticcacaulis sp. EMRT-3]|uniref:MFS transporter n=1 Tax=Asticcacaulis sp. EMRT-3 TaxID=3040349 RepID=UPI0024AF0272|nr:MFS transporter [Asticcacaulis sp. EMRT-3]MDI7774594.1 MFS transporter [Asticcacaulis sp. EMRT-3]